MKKIYKNSAGDSGVAAYESGTDFIRVWFKTGGVYVYTNASAGAGNIELMKKLAAEGQGLSTFISQDIKENYAVRER